MCGRNVTEVREYFSESEDGIYEDHEVVEHFKGMASEEEGRGDEIAACHICTGIIRVVAAEHHR